VRKNNRDSSGDSSRLRIPDKSLLLWGKHAVTAALENPDRRIYELFFSESSQTKIQKLIRSRLSISEASKIKLNALSSKDITALLPDHSVHQGFAAIVGELDYGDLDFLINKTRSSKYSFVVVLDQVTDPHNLGAVIRSAVAFSVDAIIVHDRSTPRLDGALGKAASGALEHIPIIRTKNIARAIDKLKKFEFWCIGLSDDAHNDLSSLSVHNRTAVVLGAEGEGLRRLTRESCDSLARLPTSLNFPTLNISNAASITFYEIRKHLPSKN
jgi:23S rRNA (guanosine2251-2'-O)-methyltransferase|tara:strand:+ start:5900 stop:6709 length:810 start_codon:yes stop_codon:yes gene_type:complete